MKIRFTLLALGLLLAACTREYDCDPVQLTPAFLHYTPAELQTIVYRRYQAHDNYRTLLDSVVLRQGMLASYDVRGDTTFVLADYPLRIREGFDWQIRIPATGQTVHLSAIVTKQKTGKITHGIFSLDKAAPCFNELISANLDGQPLAFKSSPLEWYSRFYIRK